MDYSLADIKAISDRDDDGFGSIGWIILLFIFILAVFGGNGGFFGNGAGGNALTQSELQNGLYNQTVDRNLADIQMQMCNNAKDTATCCCATQKGILEAQYNASLGFKDVQLQLADACADNRLAICQQTNELKTAIIEQNQVTRDLINQHYVSELADKLGIARNQISNYEQSNYILNQLGAYYQKPAVNPCTCYNTTCGCNY